MKITTGKIGEEIFKDILLTNNIPFYDLRDEIITKKIKVGEHNNIPAYEYSVNIHSHKFDFIVNNLNIEVKTSRNRAMFNWTKNDVSNIDYVVGLIINDINELKSILLFDKNYINSHTAYKGHNNSSYYPIVSKEELISALSN